MLSSNSKRVATVATAKVVSQPITTVATRFASSIASSKSKKKKATNPRMELHKFLGPKNFKGLYYRNPLAYTPDYAKYSKQTNYITAYPIQQQDRVGPSVKWDQVFKSADNRRQYSRTIDPLKPFVDNPHCKSALLVSDSLKKTILEDHNNGLSSQRISFKYKIALPRIEAILKLHTIEQEFLSQEKITVEMKKMNDIMKSMFTTIRTDRGTGLPFEPVDNLTEIPIPEETRHQRFMTIAESEPFGPVDAAKALGIEPAAVTLEELTHHETVEEKSAKSTTAKNNKLSFYAPVMEGERTLFRFTDAKVGEVGFRYGASKDDRRHARKVKYQPSGKMVWA